MKHVYVVIWNFNGNSKYYGIFTTLKKAETCKAQFLERNFVHTKDFNNLSIKKMNLNELKSSTLAA